MGTVLGAIADDFTGASDLGVLLARSGRPVTLRLGVPAGPPVDPSGIEIIALKIRTVPVAEAVAEARAALAWLGAAGAERFYWKYCSTFDSTPEGNIGPVAEALMADLGADQTIYGPAFPENGRAVFMGHLFVGEDLLAESPMKDHPLTPMRDSNLVRLLAPQVKGRVGLATRPVVAGGAARLAARLAALRAEGIAHVVVDAVADDDLAVIAEAAADLPLLTGGSALAMHLPALLERAGLLEPTAGVERPPAPEGGSIVLSGSCSAMTRRQVARHAARVDALRLDPLEIARNGIGDAVAWLAARPAEAPKLIYATAEPEEVRRAQAVLGTAEAGALIEAALATLAREALRIGVRRFVVAGGETSGAVVKELGLTRLAIGPEITPGVPWTFGESGGHPVALALKSGNFGAETFFDDAWRVLEGR